MVIFVQLSFISSGPETVTFSECTLAPLINKMWIESNDVLGTYISTYLFTPIVTIVVIPAECWHMSARCGMWADWRGDEGEA